MQLSRHKQQINKTKIWQFERWNRTWKIGSGTFKSSFWLATKVLLHVTKPKARNRGNSKGCRLETLIHKIKAKSASMKAREDIGDDCNKPHQACTDGKPSTSPFHPARQNGVFQSFSSSTVNWPTLCLVGFILIPWIATYIYSCKDAKTFSTIDTKSVY